METEYYDRPFVFDYISKIGNGDMSSEKLKELQKSTIAIRGKYRVKIILKP